MTKIGAVSSWWLRALRCFAPSPLPFVSANDEPNRVLAKSLFGLPHTSVSTFLFKYKLLTLLFMATSTEVEVFVDKMWR